MIAYFPIELPQREFKFRYELGQELLSQGYSHVNQDMVMPILAS